MLNRVLREAKRLLSQGTSLMLRAYSAALEDRDRKEKVAESRYNALLPVGLNFIKFPGIKFSMGLKII